MQLKETIPLHGELTITRSDGLVLTRSNVVVQQTIYALLQGFVNVVTTTPVGSLQIGTGGTSDSAGLIPIQPSYTQTQLNSYLATLSTTSSNLMVTNNFVTFTASVSQSQYNGYGISEAGLFTNAGNMFNYTTFPAIQKSSLFGLTFSWNIGF